MLSGAGGLLIASAVIIKLRTLGTQHRQPWGWARGSLGKGWDSAAKEGHCSLLLDVCVPLTLLLVPGCGDTFLHTPGPLVLSGTGF